MVHPYKEFEDTDLWKIVENALSELEENQDIKLTTAKRIRDRLSLQKAVRGNATA